MNLQDFITETIVQIVRGIENAGEQLKDSKALVNPRNVKIEPSATNVYGFVEVNKPFLKAVQKVEFDVAVTVSNGTTTKGGIGIMVGAIGLGSQGQSDAQSGYVSRIKFSIPVVFPMDSAPHDQE